jgi:hypothetical protein
MWCRNRRWQVCAVALVIEAATSGCSPSILGPSCIDERGPVLTLTGSAVAGDTHSYTVVSPKSSNLIIRLTWDQLEATLGLSATIINWPHGMRHGHDYPAIRTGRALAHSPAVAARRSSDGGRRLGRTKPIGSRSPETRCATRISRSRWSTTSAARRKLCALGRKTQHLTFVLGRASEVRTPRRSLRAAGRSALRGHQQR